MYSKKELGKVRDVILQAKSIIIIIHRSPDFDALGSSTALFRYLKLLGKKISIYSSSEIIQSYFFIPYSKHIKFLQGNTLPNGKHDLLILLDGSELNRFVETGDLQIPEGMKTVIIDHHFAKRVKTDYYLYSSEIASTSEIIFDLFKFSGWEITKNIAKSLLVGILGDTGWLKYEKVNPETFRKCAELLEINNCLVHLDYHFAHLNKTDFIPFWKILMENIKVDKKNSFIFTSAKYGDIKKSGILEEDLSFAYKTFLDGALRKFHDIDVSLILLEKTKGVLEGSMRSELGTVKLNEICGEFEAGGGHPRAAGFKTKKNFDDVMKIVYKGMKKYRVK